jgi:NAD(P)-dependent dehydrogenase (short-subunit alcohol dehydrogenase family)
VERLEEVVVSTAPPAAISEHRYEGRTAIVTGAGSGIGRATAVRLAAEGAAVACLDVVKKGLEETVESIVGLGSKAVAYRCDVTDESGVADTVSQATAALGRPSVLCNVAGIGAFAHTAEMPLDLWQKILAVNLTGDLPHGPGRSTANARGQGREHRQRGLERRLDGLAVVGGLLRVEGWRGVLHQGPGRRVRRSRRARERRGSRWR